MPWKTPTRRGANSERGPASVFGILRTTVVGNAQSVPDGTDTDMVFAEETLRRITPTGPVGARTGLVVPLTGIYEIGGNILLLSAVNETLQAILAVNGIGSVGNVSGSVGGNTVAHVGVSLMTPLIANDVLRLQGFVSDSGGGPHDALPSLTLRLVELT